MSIIQYFYISLDSSNWNPSQAIGKTGARAIS